MLKTASKNGFPDERLSELQKIVYDHIDILRIALSSDPPAKVEPLKVEMTSDANFVRVRLRNYSKEQRGFLKKFVSKLFKAGIAYTNSILLKNELRFWSQS